MEVVDEKANRPQRSINEFLTTDEEDAAATTRGMVGHVDSVFVLLSRERVWEKLGHVYNEIGYFGKEAAQMRDEAVTAFWTAFGAAAQAPEPSTLEAHLSYAHALAYAAQASERTEKIFLGLIKHALSEPVDEEDEEAGREKWVPEWIQDHFADFERPEHFDKLAAGLIAKLLDESVVHYVWERDDDDD
ncbi:hypothetical protein [Cyprinid herpesvirus 2]|nr:hypothetical protein [Cyprinid herpesvirus 2]